MRFSFISEPIQYHFVLSCSSYHVKNQNRAKADESSSGIVWKAKQTDCCFSFCYYSVAIPENTLFLRSPLILVACLSQILNTKRKVAKPGKKASPEIFPHGEILISNGTSSQSSSSPMTFIQQTFIRLLLCPAPFQILPLPWLCGQQISVFPPKWLVLSESITNFTAL